MKSEKGAITLVTLGTVIFILAFLLSSFVTISNKLQAQAEIKKETKKIYEREVENVDEIYNEYFVGEKINRVQYIESTGTQYIDTKITPDSNTTFELSIELNDISTTQAIFGSRKNKNENSFDLFFVNNHMRWDYNTTNTSANLTYTVGTKIKINKDATSTTVEANGETKTITNSTTDFNNTYSMYIFSIQQSGTAETRHAKMKLYYLKIYKNGNLVGNYVPALDSKKVPCLYDEVTQKYFYNVGTGNFNYK